MTDLKGRKILFFRCHFDPSIGPMPKKAYHSDDMKLDIEMNAEGVYVKESNGTETIVPFANVEMIRLRNMEPKRVKATA